MKKTFFLVLGFSSLLAAEAEGWNVPRLLAARVGCPGAPGAVVITTTGPKTAGLGERVTTAAETAVFCPEDRTTHLTRREARLLSTRRYRPFCIAPDGQAGPPLVRVRGPFFHTPPLDKPGVWRCCMAPGRSILCSDQGVPFGMPLRCRAVTRAAKALNVSGHEVQCLDISVGDQATTATTTTTTTIPEPGGGGPPAPPTPYAENPRCRDWWERSTQPPPGWTVALVGPDRAPSCSQQPFSCEVEGGRGTAAGGAIICKVAPAYPTGGVAHPVADEWYQTIVGPGDVRPLINTVTYPGDTLYGCCRDTSVGVICAPPKVVEVYSPPGGAPCL